MSEKVKKLMAEVDDTLERLREIPGCQARAHLREPLTKEHVLAAAGSACCPDCQRGRCRERGCLLGTGIHAYGDVPGWCGVCGQKAWTSELWICACCGTHYVICNACHAWALSPDPPPPLTRRQRLALWWESVKDAVRRARA